MAYRQNATTEELYELEQHKLEIVTVCSGFPDVLEYTIAANTCHADNYIVVTTHEDRATQQLCDKWSIQCVPTDLFQKNDRPFNKGAGINAGFLYFRHHGWRLHIDADIRLPKDFRRLLMNHIELDRSCIYGATRFDLVGQKGVEAIEVAEYETPLHAFHSGCSPVHRGAVYPEIVSASSTQFVSDLHGYVPIGFFQLWHASQQKPYPHSMGTAAMDDVAFGALWPRRNRRLLPGIFVGHVCSVPPYYGQNWGGRRSPRMDRVRKK